MAFDNDPVGNGFVASLARPGSNITGLSTLAPGDKRQTTGAYEGDHSETRARGRIRQFDPSGQRTSVKRDANSPPGHSAVQLQYSDVRDVKDIETAFRAANKGRADAVLVLENAVTHFAPKTAGRFRGKEPAPGDVPTDRNLWKPAASCTTALNTHRFVSPCRHLCGQDFERHETRRSSRRAADQVRVHRQSEGGEADRPDDSAERAGAGGSGDSIR